MNNLKLKTSYRNAICLFLMIVLVVSMLGIFIINSNGTAHAANDSAQGPTYDYDEGLGNGGQAIYDPDAFMYNLHKKKKSLSISRTTTRLLNVTQFSQSTLNNTYNNNNGTSVGGTCGIVACSTISYYYRQRLAGYGNIPNNINTIFAEYINIYGITGNEGTSPASYRNTLKTFFQAHGYTMETDYSTHLNKFTKMRNHIIGNRPSIISVSGTNPYGSHAMVVTGYIKYKVSYKILGIRFNKTEYMYAIDEGWGMGQYAYLHEDYMPNTWYVTNLWPA